MEIGITGGIGSGKSFVCEIFERLGIPTYNSDQRAKRLMVESERLVAGIKAAFGQEAYLVDGALNREYLAQRVFSDSGEIKKLNALVHPAVARDYKKWAKAMLKEHPYVIKEAALLFESGSYKKLDETVTVYASEPTRIIRVLERDPQRSVKQVRGIIAKQMKEEERQRYASHVIDNDGERPLVPQILKLHERYLLRTAARQPLHASR